MDMLTRSDCPEMVQVLQFFPDVVNVKIEQIFKYKLFLFSLNYTQFLHQSD